MNKNIEHSKKLGYTLIELMLVIALIAIVLSISTPSLNLIFNTAENKELMEFKRDIIFARNRAVMENGIYTLKINIPENKYIVLRDHSRKAIVQDKKFSKGVVLKLDNLDHSIRFYPTGTPNKAGTIRLTNKRNQNIIITIAPATGKVNLKIDGK